MQLGMVGLGRMGSNLVRRLLADGHHCVVSDLNADAVAGVEAEGAEAARDLADLAAKLEAPRVVWVMVPAAVAPKVIDAVVAELDEGDIVIDGGNSNYRHALDRAEALADAGIHHVDIGTSGGVHGLDRGFCLMVGGDEAAVTRLEPILNSLAPGIDSAERTPGRSGPPSPGEVGWLHCGPPGAGHFVKMVHNGIEYGMMAAMAEGMNILNYANIGTEDRAADAETTPLTEAKYFQYDFDLASITEVWRRGSVISSWLVDLTAAELAEDPELAGFEGRVSDSGEGRWTVDAALIEGAPAPVIAAALFQRFSSRGRADYGDKVLSAMRRGFG
ncbi:MAG: decarboxylating 6-phosphogluconate dehydrogenase, partial [Actinomycetia bacterium]|nr:decarboxylating 6-phosphogluconate dehydrogenase [Actinomycetes bacterium]